MKQAKGIHEFILDEHTDYCKITHNETTGWSGRDRRALCELNPEIFIFYANGFYIVVKYYACFNMGGHLEWKQMIVESAMVKTKGMPKYQVSRSVKLNETLNEIRHGNLHLNRYLRQVNYFYWDNAYNRYAITTKSNYVKELCNNDKLHQSTKEAIEFVRTRPEYKHLEQDILELFKANYLYVTEQTMCNTIDSLIKQIKNEINQTS